MKTHSDRPDDAHVTQPRAHPTGDTPRHPAPPPPAKDTAASDPVDSHTWTGDVEEQKAEAKTLLLGIVIAVAIAAPLVAWIGRVIARTMGL
jgi:hypothetical protein